jgi:hypothetical protein
MLTVVVPLMLAELALIVEEPAFTPFTTPELLTVALV